MSDALALESPHFVSRHIRQQRPVFTRAVVLGGGRIACDCLVALSSAGLPVHAIHNDTSPFSLLHRAANRPNCTWQQLANPESLAGFFLSIHEPTLVVSANNAWIVPPKVLDNPNLRFINYHNSLLPRHRGRNAPTWAIHSGDQYTGATWHLIDSGIDTGPIIAQQTIAITPRSTALQLVAECMRVAAALFNQFLPSLLTWSFSSSPPALDRSEYHSSHHVPALGLLDPALPLTHISRLLRSLDYGPLDILPRPKLLVPQLPPSQYPVIARYTIQPTVSTQPIPQVAGCSTHVIERPDASIILWLSHKALHQSRPDQQSS